MTKKKTHKEYLREINAKYNNEYEILEEYINTHEPILTRHNKCGYEWKSRPHDLLSGHGCPKCGVEKYSCKRRMTPKEFEDKLKKISNGKIKALEKYKNSRTKIKFKCLECNHEWSSLPNNILSKRSSCPNCYGNIKKTTEQFKQEVYNIVKDEYTVIGEYQGTNKKLLIRHNSCGNEWMITPSKFLLGRRCPLCNESHGEIEIRKYLVRNCIKFKRQYRISECKLNKSLPFDFALFDKDKLIALIEYQGRQHYKFIEFFGKNGRFEKQQIRDNIKRKYCSVNNIPLIEIPYTVKNIDCFLTNELSKLNKTML